MPADDGDQSQPDVPQTPPSSDDEDKPSYAADHDADTQHPAPGSDNSTVTREEITAQQEAINAAMKGVQERAQRYQADEASLQKELDALKTEANQAPPKEVPYALPAPPSQETKNGVAVAATNILKLATLATLAYGLRGRSHLRNSVFKLGLAAAFNGYMQGNNEQRDKALSTWEKNRQAINDLNRQQHQANMDIIRNEKLSLQQKMDIFNEQGKLMGIKRMEEAGASRDVGKIQSMLNDEIKLQRQFEKQSREASEAFYKAMGITGKERMEYRDWVLSKGGPDVRGKSEDEMYEIEKKYPYSDMLQKQAADKAQEELTHATEVERAKTKARLEEEDKFKKEHAPGADNPLGLNLGD